MFVAVACAVGRRAWDATFGELIGRRLRGLAREDGCDFGQIILPVEHTADRPEIALAPAEDEGREGIETVAQLERALGRLLHERWREAAAELLQDFGGDDGDVIALDEAFRITGEKEHRF